MRQLIILVGLVLAFACGTDRGTLQTDANTPSQTSIPESQLDDSMQGEWSFTRHWNKGTTVGPLSWSKVLVTGKMMELSSGEESKDSGSWTVAGHYGVVSGQGSSDNPFVLRMHIEKAIGDDLHPAPISKGATVEFKVHLKGEVLSVDFPKSSMTLVRSKPASAHSCTSDEDCFNSCTFGAVNKIWYSKTVDSTKECKDGCASKGSDSKCEVGSCVAYLRGKRSDHCTKRKID